MIRDDTAKLLINLLIMIALQHQSKIQENHFGFKDKRCDKVPFSLFQEAILERVGSVTYGGYQVT